MERRKVGATLLAFFVFSLAPGAMNAQQRIFEKLPLLTPAHPDFGPNRKNFYHAFFSATVAMPLEELSGLHTVQPFTGQISLGFRYKLKLTKPLAFVADGGLSHYSWKIGQENGKSLPDTVLHDRQSLRSNGLFGGISLRIRTGQGGDYLGNFIDLGIVARASFMNIMRTSDRMSSGGTDPQIRERFTTTTFRDINLFSYSALLRVGFDRFSLIAAYRLSRLLKLQEGTDLPEFEFGIGISPVRY